MVAELGSDAAGRLDAGIGDEANQDDVRDPLLLEQEVEIRVSEPAFLRLFFSPAT
jgi:hypothetical protein